MTQSNYYLYVMTHNLWVIRYDSLVVTFFPLLFISVEKKQKKTENKENKAL